MGTFPFGWVRGLGDENWQILWSAEEKRLYVKGVRTSRILTVDAASTWEEAKALGDRVQSEPEAYIKFESA